MGAENAGASIASGSGTGGKGANGGGRLLDTIAESLRPAAGSDGRPIP